MQDMGSQEQKIMPSGRGGQANPFPEASFSFCSNQPQADLVASVSFSSQPPDTRVHAALPMFQKFRNCGSILIPVNESFSLIG